MVDSNKSDLIVIKKYSNRRLYNTDISNYVTLEDLFQMVKNNSNFIVIDAKTGDDITRSVLTQIILEQEAKGYNMLPVSFLRQIISFYGDNVTNILPQYLEKVMQPFSDYHEKITENSFNSENYTSIKFFEEAAKQNMAMFEKTFNMFYGKTPSDTEK
jgi:polyhydroxyalkanoate synthesis repressor PhaR